MQITINELLDGKATIIKNKSYLSTNDYAKPFLDTMSKFTDDFRVKVKLPDQMTVGGVSQDITYNRVLIEAVLPAEFTVDKHDEVIGFLYGLDVRKPISKIYRGHLNSACTNLTVFNSNWMTVQEIKPSELIDITGIKSLMEAPSNFKNKIETLKKAFIGRSQLVQSLGSWVDSSLRHHHYNGFQNVKISPNVPVEAYKMLFLDETSEYYVPETEVPSLFHIYNAFTQIITNDDKDIMNKFEKTMMVNKLLGI